MNTTMKRVSYPMATNYEPTPPAADDTAAPGRRLDVTGAASVTPRRIRWLVDNWIPADSLTLLAGREGIGKSTIAADLAAQATRGEWGGPMRVLYVATEDSRAMVTVPRLLAAGADMDQIDFLDVHAAGLPGALDLPRDHAALARLVADRGHGLIVLDPVTAVMSGRLNPNHAADVRAVLDPLARLADKAGCAILAVSHFGKAATADTGRAVLGSAAWSQVPRSVLAVAADDTNGGLVVTNTKSNLARAVVSRTAAITDHVVPIPGAPAAHVGAVDWGGVTDRDARDLMDADQDDTRAARRGLDEWLRDYLNDGARWSRDVAADGKAAGWSLDQLRRSLTRMGGKCIKVGAGGWAWHLPGTPNVPAEATPAAAPARKATA